METTVSKSICHTDMTRTVPRGNKAQSCCCSLSAPHLKAEGYLEVILPRWADTARDARRAGRAGEVQHQVTAGRRTGHASSLLGAAVVNLPLLAFSDLVSVWLYNTHAHTEESGRFKNQPRQLVSHEKQATTTNVRLLITTRPETVLCCWNEREQELKGGEGAQRLPFSSGTHSIFPFLHRLMEETGREKKGMSV